MKPIMDLALVRDGAQRLVAITTKEDAQLAGRYLRAIRTSIREIRRKYQEVRRPIRNALKDIQQQEQADLQPYLEAEQSVDAPLIAWQVADRQRVEADRKALVAAAQADEQARRTAAAAELLQAAKAMKGGLRAALKEQARIIQSTPGFPAVSSEDLPTPTKIDGISLREYWSADVYDAMALVRAVALGQVPLAAVIPNQEWLDSRATSLGNEMAYPGVTAVKRHGQTAQRLG